MIQALQKVLGDPNDRKVRQYRPTVKLINSLEIEIASLSDAQLKAKTTEFRQRLEKGETLDDLLPEAFAVVREAGKRVLSLRHYDVQMIGGIVLHEGQIAEMKTGEGKTLVATLPAYLNGLSGKGVHVVTVNDYLARRDAEWMGQLHRFLGLTVGLIQSGMSPQEKRRNYACDVTYCTNSELGFDYLRDNMANSMQDVMQRPFNYCVIDETDSILIDEARTPLIISGQVERPSEKYQRAADVARELIKEDHYEVDEKARNITLTDEGFEAAEQALGVSDLFDPKDPWAHFIFNAVKSKELFIKDVNYIVRNDEIVIVDEFTGRVLSGRRWSDGLHQAVEAKEGVTIQKESQTLASITYQNLFLLYPKLSGMTGTARTEEAEFNKTYNIEVTVIPTNRAIRRKDAPDVVYKTENGKWTSVAEEIRQMQERGRPVLVGTTSVEKSERLAAILRDLSISYNLLNAKPENVERESEIVAQAGRKGAVTIATNMAGRGTDIILGGNADYMARLKLRERLMPKLVQLDLDDPMGGVGLRLGAKGGGRGFGGPSPGKPKSWAVSQSLYPCELSEGTTQALEQAVTAAVEKYGLNTQQELTVEDLIAVACEKAPVQDPLILQLRDVYLNIKQEYEALTDAEHDEVVKLGGLHVIGTERHESRRVDNQLRGRSGRQGDPGSTRFFLSLEDPLLKIFGGERVSKIMDMFRVEEDMPIESGMLTSSLENAQRKVEVYYYDIRKQVFEYDEVMNNQRKAIYAERRRSLEGQNLKPKMMEYADQTIAEIVAAYVNPDLPPEEWELDKLVAKVKEFVPLLNDLTPKKLENYSLDELRTYLQEQARLAYEAQESFVDTVQPGLMRKAEQFFLLQQIDTLWREHLQQMDALRESVGLRGYGQKDPLIEYKNEGYELFLDMMSDIRRNTVFNLYQFRPQMTAPAQTRTVQAKVSAATPVTATTNAPANGSSGESGGDESDGSGIVEADFAES
jgi:preprotein translocase subunit SecA